MYVCVCVLCVVCCVYRVCKYIVYYIPQKINAAIVDVCLLNLLQEARVYAEENGLFFMETSAKTAANVNEIFYEIGLYPYHFFMKLDC